MAATSFVVLATGEGWTVFQDGEPLEQRGTRVAAVELAHVLATRINGFDLTATLLVQDDVGELHAWDLNAGAKLLARLLDSRRSSPAQA